ncbi:MAG: hypothetical protein JWM95_1925 [Gemmatimonadetes bacterium]|nr:hypothetical protein [Gemmatimonadota bacterium]
MRGIRPFAESDIASVIALHCDAFGNPRPQTTTAKTEYRQWLTAVFLTNPMRIKGLESIVFEDDGQIIGFLGIVARRLRLNGSVYRGSICSNFCVRPDRRGGVGSQLLSHYREMDQDVAFVDEVRDRAGALFVRRGWNISALQSVRWVLPLRPAERVLATLKHRIPSALVRATRPAIRVVDTALRRLPRSPFRPPVSTLTRQELTSVELARLLEEFGSDQSLRPMTSDGSTAWLVGRAREMTDAGDLHMISVADDLGAVIGWYIYYAMRGGQGEVLQLVSAHESAREVLEDLAHHAYERGVLALSGTLHTDFLPHLASRRAVLDSASGSRWMLVHSRVPAIMEAFWRGDLLTSRLDGEWCHHLR